MSFVHQCTSPKA